MDGLLSLWQGVDGVSQIDAHGNHVVALVDDSNRVLPRFFDIAASKGMRITAVDIQEPNLETVFLHLTGRALRD